MGEGKSREGELVARGLAACRVAAAELMSWEEAFGTLEGQTRGLNLAMAEAIKIAADRILGGAMNPEERGVGWGEDATTYFDNAEEEYGASREDLVTLYHVCRQTRWWLHDIAGVLEAEPVLGEPPTEESTRWARRLVGKAAGHLNAVIRIAEGGKS